MGEARRSAELLHSHAPLRIRDLNRRLVAGLVTLPRGDVVRIEQVPDRGVNFANCAMGPVSLAKLDRAMQTGDGQGDRPVWLGVVRRRGEDGHPNTKLAASGQDMIAGQDEACVSIFLAVVLYDRSDRSGKSTRGCARAAARNPPVAEIDASVRG
jgi:hypothetical protein